MQLVVQLVSGSSSWASFHGAWNPLSATARLWVTDPEDLMYSETTVDRERQMYAFI